MTFIILSFTDPCVGYPSRNHAEGSCMHLSGAWETDLAPIALG